MIVDFHAEYQHWTDADLQAVLRNANQYQPAAVAAAEAILTERGVPLYVHVEAVAPPAAADVSVSEEGNLFDDFFESEQPKAPRLVWIMFAVACLYCGYTLFVSLKTVYSVVVDNPEMAGVGILVSLSVSVGFTGLLLALIVQRKRWGWLLLAADLGYSLAPLAVRLPFLLFRMGPDLDLIFFLVLVPLFMKGVMAWRWVHADVLRFFKVSRQERWKPFVFGGVAGICMFLLYFARDLL